MASEELAGNPQFTRGEISWLDDRGEIFLDGKSMPDWMTGACVANAGTHVVLRRRVLAAAADTGRRWHCALPRPRSFYGFALESMLPNNLLRSWHLQTAIF
ncbi:MAG: hypothetical protein NVS2B4_00580 [Ramlibacter sp.]